MTDFAVVGALTCGYKLAARGDGVAVQGVAVGCCGRRRKSSA
jgi:hypothetical protein